MGFNRRIMEDRRRQAAEKEAAARRATEKQILEDADHLVAVWNERQAKRMPMLCPQNCLACTKLDTAPANWRLFLIIYKTRG
jgi:hypothetical protein